MRFFTKLFFLSWFISFSAQAQSITVGTVSPTTLCAGDNILIPFTKTGTFNSGNIFTAQLSNALGSFASPTDIGTLIGTSAGTITGTIPLMTPNGTNYRIRVVSSSPSVVSGNISAAINVTTTTGDPSIFGNGQWNAYVYEGNILTGTATYRGFYTHTALSFDSNTRWGQATTPSLANGTGGAAYTGCQVPIDGHSVSYKRTNFTCGFYNINLTRTDLYELIIDGVVVATNTGSGTLNNRWRGFLGPNSQVEARWFDNTSPDANSRLALTFSTLSGDAMIATPVAPICANTSATINLISSATNQLVDFREYPANYTFSWSGPPGFTTNVAGTQLTTAPGAAGTYTVTATHIPTGCVISGSVTVTLAPPPNVVVTPSSVTACPGEPTVLTASGATTYTWSPATGLSATTGATVTASPTVTTTYTVTGSDGCNTSSATVTVTVVPNPSDPNTFGDGEWFVACYQGNNFNRYFGYYTHTSLSFDSNTRWAQNSTPSNANAIGGAAYVSGVSCAIPADNHSFIYRRTNFACGYYRLRVLNNDDHAFVLINGTQVWQRTSISSTAVTAWEGFLGASSTVEIRSREFTGNSRLNVQLTDITATLAPVTSPLAVTICQSSATTITTDILPLQVLYNSNGTFNSNVGAANVTFTQITGNPGDFTITPSGNDATVTANVTPTPNPATIRVSFTDPVSGCVISRDVQVQVDPLPSTAVTASNLTICVGESVTLTASGANTYTWSPAAGLSATTGAVVTATPLNTTTYTVSGNNNCATIDASVTITVIVPALTGVEFGTDEWIAHSYNGALITDPANAVYRGHYTEKSISFNSQTRWAQDTNPSLATNQPDGSLGYAGCSVNSDHHSISFRRTNFPCGFYTISVGRNDRYELWINGTLVASSTAAGFTPFVWSGLLNDASTVELRVQETTGNSYGQLSIGFALASATTSVWTGAIDNDWFNPLNWCPVVPTEDIDAIIPGGGVTNFPIINGVGAETRNIQIATGATLTINANLNLDVHGDYIQDGNLVANNNTSVNMVHNTTPASATLQVTGTGAFYNLNIDKLSNVVTMLSGVQVNNQLVLNNGELNLNNQTLTINNSSLAAIIRNNNAFIRSETNAATNNSRVCWNMGATVGAFVFPFGVSATEYIPVAFNKLTNTSSNICIATRATATADNTPWATGVTNVVGVSGATAINDVVDRWWNITSTVNPLPAPGANVTFSYRGIENTLANPKTDNLAVQHWNGTDWDPPYAVGSAGVITGVGSVTAQGITTFSPFVISREIRPLPVRLISFTAQARVGFVWLDWQIAQRVNNEVYTIERSGNGSHFEAIGVVRSENKDQYEWVDKNPLQGVSYYRLKRQDDKGNIEYSRIEAVNLLAFVKEGMTIIPNPSNGETVMIVLQSVPQEEGILTVTDALGRIVYEAPLRTDEAGRSDKQIRALLPRGVYVVQIRTTKKIYQEKLVVR